jgi:hypothetical protein
MMGLLCDELTQPGAGRRAGTTGAASAPSPS